MAIQDFSHSLPMMLYRALHALMPPFRRIFTAAGLTEQQWRVLRVLWEHEEIAQGALAGLTLIPAPSLIGVLDRLTINGLIERHRSPDDRRVVNVAATRAGRRLEEKLMPAVADVYATLRASLDNKTWTQLEFALQSLSGAPRPIGRKKKRASRPRLRSKS